LLYPEVCQLCGGTRATPAEGYVCGGCRAKVRFIRQPFCERCGRPYEGDITTQFECTNCREMEWHFQSARSAVAARDPVLEAIHRYKYQRAFWFEPFLAELLIQAARPALGGRNGDMIVPVPLHPTKQREREFNQAERLANRLGAATQMRVKKGLLRRVVATRTQALLRGSPAINAGSNPRNLATDQRGATFPRSVNGAADMGAFEFGLSPTPRPTSASRSARTAASGREGPPGPA
jgi:predicted amidophosphoribosyltransferase